MQHSPLALQCTSRLLVEMAGVTSQPLSFGGRTGFWWTHQTLVDPPDFWRTHRILVDPPDFGNPEPDPETWAIRNPIHFNYAGFDFYQHLYRSVASRDRGKWPSPSKSTTNPQMASFIPYQAPPQESLWQQHRGLFEQLYIAGNKTLKEVKEIAERDHGFPKTP